MGLDKKTAESDSEGIEHHVSDRTLKKMKRPALRPLQIPMLYLQILAIFFNE